MAREITVGRNPQCGIRLGQECVYASGMHARIFMNGSQLVFQDVSRNGTLINGRMINNCSVAITEHDRILLAGRYPLEWNRIVPFFQHNNTMFEPAMAEPTQFSNNYESPIQMSNPQPNLEPNFSWNWGAFSLYPLWGFWNGCWWSILIYFFFGWSFIPSILYGAMGSKWAWNNKTWKSVADFNEMQDAWKPWGIAVFILNILSIIIFWSFWYSFFVGLDL